MLKYFSRNMQYIRKYKKEFLFKFRFRNYINYFKKDFLNWLFIDPIDKSKYKIGIEDGTYWEATFKIFGKEKGCRSKKFPEF